MPYGRISLQTKTRYLIGGFQNSGKTYSLPTFLYGYYDFLDSEERADALSYANGKSMVVISCPSEFGTTPSLEPYDKDPDSGIEVYEYTVPDGRDLNTVQGSSQVIDEFNALYTEVTKNKPDILAVDGIHSLWDHSMNMISRGEYMKGGDISLNREGEQNSYQSAAYHNRSHEAFSNYIANLSRSSIPLVISTIWLDYKAQESDSKKPGSIQANRVIWPDVPGKMATRITGKFDAYLVARKYPKCLHKGCEYDRKNQAHYVWQFGEADDIKGVGIKALRPTKAMLDKPYIHQNYEDLKALIERYRG